MSNTLLITGFDPFGDEAINPSWEAVKQLHGRTIGHYNVHAVQLPTSFERAGAVLGEAMEQIMPDAVICVGQAGGRPDITLERVAINLQDARIPDNDGAQPTDGAIVEGGPVAYWARMPLKAIRAAVLEAGIPCSISYTAGTFVCNAIFYWLMNRMAEQEGSEQTRGGFIHIPFLPVQAARYSNMSSMSIDDVVKALETVIVHLNDVENTSDSAGTLHGA
ncbi:pyroglutamyl-peptidase I [Paenibacillus alvei]|uniref:pyroglutamyl-peptidase I n=1 Tax=Paenibacillus alvei TaxID=44250 RepID=UPI0018CE314E|nr:pyroglutamyl-peptidase I [Paenibacillus alvei]MBG9737383.1 pyrrolidone-carboxylate peptidase [Paenibacillus alvei]MBG9746075.1 pyrrolidone-carboxylate peptidase [Paenibacillus alvei]MCY9579074.1 pyroglutamyl-peptidase I [Paenibacillus alvei]MCY9583502.1 pyroglutamyl-peptidase I [Paenibacillus alvei]